MAMSDVDDVIELLREAGDYETDAAVVEDAIRSLLRSNPGLKTEFAVEEYWAGRVSRNRAAEIAGLSPEEFTELLHDRGIPREAGFLSAEDRDRELGEL